MNKFRKTIGDRKPKTQNEQYFNNFYKYRSTIFFGGGGEGRYGRRIEDGSVKKMKTRENAFFNLRIFFLIDNIMIQTASVYSFNNNQKGR